ASATAGTADSTLRTLSPEPRTPWRHRASAVCHHHQVAAAEAAPIGSARSNWSGVTASARLAPPNPDHMPGAAYGNHAPEPSATTTCVITTTASSAEIAGR